MSCMKEFCGMKHFYGILYLGNIFLLKDTKTINGMKCTPVTYCYDIP